MWKPTVRRAALIAIIGMPWCWDSTRQLGQSDDRELKYSYAGSARVMGRGRYMTVTIYKFNDNREVSWTWEPNLPPGAAELELQERLQGDVDIVERMPVLSDRGEKVGERVVALFHLNGRGAPPHAFLWKNHGGTVYRIEGTSMDQILEIERNLK